MKIKVFKGKDFKILLYRVSGRIFTIKTVLDDGMVLYKRAKTKPEADEIFFEAIRVWKAVYQIF